MPLVVKVMLVAKVKMILQTRDIEILKFINKFGYVNHEHIKKMFSFSQPRAYQVMARLFKADYVAKEQILAKEPHIYTLRTKATELLKANRVKTKSLQNLKHNLLLVDVYIDLKHKNPDLEILSDRELRAGRGFGAKGHIPDMEIVTPEQDGKKNIAVELELSRKSIKRVKSILSSLERKYIQTHYYCDNSVFDHIAREIKFKSNIKAFNYFKLEELPKVRDVVDKVENSVTTELKDLNIKVTRLENELKRVKKDKELEEFKKDKLKDELESIQKAFVDIEFKKATFGSSYSLSSEDLENLKRLLRV